MAEKHYNFFQNRECEFFPCHEGIDEKDFNCLFCYCPLYALGKKCGGKCTYNERGYKVCSDCTFPHHREHYAAVLLRYTEIMEVVKETDRRNAEKP